ncbi:MAG: zinc ribbon domain-containing protein [Planctomycetota bacterium]|nr:zinc ribbon domain-containing protein [Planctomycetota bacterium]
MAEIITCDCGSRVRLPEDKANRSFRCPVCKMAIALTIDATVLKSTRLGDKAIGCACPICQTDIGGDEPAIVCPGCDQFHHVECWSTIGGCGTYGCKQAPSLPKSSTPAGEGGWGDFNNCPSCGEEIKSSALKCRHCGVKFETAEPLTPRELKKRREQKAAAGQLRYVMPGLLILSVLGCPAPLTLVVSGILVAMKKKELQKAGPLYVVLGYASIVVSAIYTLLLLAFGAYSMAN